MWYSSYIWNESGFLSLSLSLSLSLPIYLPSPHHMLIHLLDLCSGWISHGQTATKPHLFEATVSSLTFSANVSLNSLWKLVNQRTRKELYPFSQESRYLEEVDNWPRNVYQRLTITSQNFWSFPNTFRSASECWDFFEATGRRTEFDATRGTARYREKTRPPR